MFYTFLEEIKPTTPFSMFDVFSGILPKNQKMHVDYPKKVTIRTNRCIPIEYLNAQKKRELLIKAYLLAADLQNKQPHYQIFKIPKSSGGTRNIAAPDEETKELQNKIKIFLERQLKLLPHDAAFAYIQMRSAQDALIRHVNAESNFYLKVDLENFFPNTNYEFIMKQLKELQIVETLSQYHNEVVFIDCLGQIIKFCMLNDGLPQGSPVSPLLSNIVMTKIDFFIQNYCDKFNLIYTRYADDILISGKNNFDYRKVIGYLSALLKYHTPYHIKEEKTRYGSNKGRNWNLGLMINRDNKITIGYRKKERFRATIYNFFSDLTNGKPWDILDIQALLGTIAYYKKIDSAMVSDVILKYNLKFKMNFEEEIKKMMM